MTGRRFDAEILLDDNFENSDLLGRKPLSTALINFVENSDQSMVVALDAEWGSGKTHFLKLWCNELRNQEIPFVYFNAFENDFASDAFVSLSSSFLSKLADQASVPEDAKSDFLAKAGHIGKILGRSAINIGIRAATAGVVDAVDAGEAIDAAIEQTGTETSRNIL